MGVEIEWVRMHGTLAISLTELFPGARIITSAGYSLRLGGHVQQNLADMIPACSYPCRLDRKNRWDKMSTGRFGGLYPERPC